MSQVANRATRQQDAEDEVEGFRRNLGPFVVAAETTRALMVFTNPAESRNPIIFVNDAFLAFTGYERDELLGRDFNYLLARGANPEALEKIDAAFAGDYHEQLEIRDRRKDGSTAWVSLSINPVWDENGVVVQHFSSFVDITKSRREAKRLRILLDELNHRTQNTMATVLAIASQTLRSSADRHMVDAFHGRVLALSKAHGLLGRGDWDAVPLRDVLDSILLPFTLGESGAARIAIGGEDVRMHDKAALSLALVFHELASNAVAHGSLSIPEGKVSIAWWVEHADSDAQLSIVWQESGGPRVSAPTRKGFGARLIEAGLAQELGGEVNVAYAEAGLTCHIVMPLKAAAGA